MRRLVAVLLLLLVAVLLGGDAAACDVCYGAAPGTPMIDGARTGVFLLLGVTVGVQGGFAAFFVYLWRRGRRAHDEEIDSEWSDLQRRSKRS